MKNLLRAAALVLLVSPCGCRLFEPATIFAVKVELGLQPNPPPNWDHVKELAMRPAPRVGQPAPDFTVTSLDGGEVITRSAYQAGRPLVLIFGSYT